MPEPSPPAAQTSPPRPRTWLLLPVFLVVSVVMAFPSVNKIGSHVAGDHGDAMFSLWLLRWVGRSIAPGPPALTDPNIFEPFERTLFYSETYLTPGVFFSVLDRIVNSPALAFNLIYLSTWVLSCLFTYLLAFHFTGKRWASVVAAFAFTFSAIRLGHYRHFQLSMAFFVPLILFLLVKYLERPRIYLGVAIGLSLAALMYAATYYAMMMSLAVALAFLGHLLITRFRNSRRSILGMGLAGIVSISLMLPAALAYLDVQSHQHFDRGPEIQFLARMPDFLTPADDNLLVAKIPWLAGNIRRTNIEKELFPGAVALLAGSAGIFVLLFARSFWQSPENRARRRTLGVLLFVGLVFVMFAAGDRAEIRGKDVLLPYHLLSGYVPGFRGIRATARYVVLFQCVLSICAAVGLSYFLRNLKRDVRVGLAVVLATLVLVESAIVIDFIDVPLQETYSAVNRRLKDLPAGVVVELPIRSHVDPEWGAVEGPRQFLSTLDWNDRVNGYSGFDPPGFAEVAIDLNEFPNFDSFHWIDKFAVRYVVLRTAPIGTPEVELAREEGRGFLSVSDVERKIALIPPERLARVTRLGEAYLLELLPPPAETRS